MLKETVTYNLKNARVAVYDMALSKKGKARRYRGEHFHKEAELVLVASGTINLLIDDTTVVLTAGQSAYIGMNRIHRLSPTEDDAKVLILQLQISEKSEGELQYVSDEALRALLLMRRTEPYALFLEEGNEFSGLLSKILTELTEKKDYYETYIQGYMQIIVGFLSRKSITSSQGAGERAAIIKKVEPIAKYISENFVQKITLDTVSEEVKYDKYYICKLIKSALGITFTEYLCYVRLRHAEGLLFSTDMPISQIVYETGFSTPQNFFKVFKATYGYTPHKYKMLYRPTDQ
jgi:AraC-like DNA-binding protein/quercetin dioxygenase-like cupin family protein